MMTIGNISKAGAAMPAAGSGFCGQSDSVGKNIENQIANAQKKLQELASDSKLTPEEKMKKRQEIQQEITSLTQQLRQHQIEQRKKMQEQKTSAEKSAENAPKTNTASGKNKGLSLSPSGLQNVLAADAARKQADVSGSSAAQLEGKSAVLKSEIKMDASRGSDTSKKEAELASLHERAQAAGRSQISALADANKEMKEASDAERTKTHPADRTEKEDERKEEGSLLGKAADKPQKTDERNEAAATQETSDDTQRTAYRPVDLYL